MFSILWMQSSYHLMYPLVSLWLLFFFASAKIVRQNCFLLIGYNFTCVLSFRNPVLAIKKKRLPRIKHFRNLFNDIFFSGDT
mmetsp:Transcript_37099/g.54542  ORF Transcript_37099/g.54542 Transcript_37099/m.54542 type:complete len:82 (+) Transcript_37099:151-396(+)